MPGVLRHGLAPTTMGSCRQAAAILGTTTLRETIHASLVEVVNAQRRFELLALLGEESRFDFDAAEPAWGGDE